MVRAKKIPIEYLKTILHYNQETGEFFWKERPQEHFKSITSWKSFNIKFAGKKAGSVETTVSGYKYLAIKVDRIVYKQHRIAWAWVNGDTEMFIDHLNGDSTDNRISNLRETTPSENSFNTKKASKYAAHGIRPKDGKWEVWFPINGNSLYFGRYDTEYQAVEKRKQLEEQFGILRGVPNV